MPGILRDGFENLDDIDQERFEIDLREAALASTAFDFGDPEESLEGCDSVTKILSGGINRDAIGLEITGGCR